MTARIRTIKPSFFTHEGLYDLELETGLPVRVAFAGLWTQADREGRFEWRPRPLKAAVLPYDEVDFGSVLEALERSGFVIRYEVGGTVYGCIPTWLEHQRPNVREPQSEIPAPPSSRGIDANAKDEAGTDPHVHARASETTDDDSRTCTHVHARAPHVHARVEREREREREGEEERALPPGVRVDQAPVDAAAARALSSRAIAPRAIADPDASEPDRPSNVLPFASPRRGRPRTDGELRTVFEAVCQGLGQRLSWSHRYVLPVEQICRDADAAALELHAIQQVAAYYRGQCQSAPPSLARFAERFDHWRAACEAQAKAPAEAAAGDAFWDALRADAAARRLDS